MKRVSDLFKDNVRDWYIRSFPDDNMEYAYIPGRLTFGDLACAVLSSRKTAANRKAVRFMFLSNNFQERILGELSKRLNVPYDSVLNEVFSI